MKNEKTRDKSSYARPQKFVLYMARKGEDWSGKVQSFDWNEEFKFTSLDDLRDWLNRQAELGKKI